MNFKILTPNPPLRFTNSGSARPRTNGGVQHHTGGGASMWGGRDVTSVQDIHRWHLNNGWAGIGYHLYVRLNGDIFQGRPIDRVGAHTGSPAGTNNSTVGVCAEGNYETVHRVMPDAQFNALVWIYREYLPSLFGPGWIRGHNEFMATACPGRFFPMAELRMLEYRGQENITVGEEMTPTLFEVTTRTSPLNVRSLPSASGTLRGTLPRGSRVEVIRRSGGWLYVVYGALTGWASADFLTKVVDVFRFTDVPAGAWFAPAVREMWERGIVTGTTPTTFAPNDTLTRAAAVTLLYRLDGMIDTGLDANFSDVCCCAWYHDAVAWAASLGIVQGVGDNQFAPGGDMTREAMAVMLWRYAATTGQDVTVPEDFTLDFADVAEVSVWATEAMYWAVYRGIMRGTDGWRLNPLGTATRAEAAVLLQRFVNLTQ